MPAKKQDNQEEKEGLPDEVVKELDIHESKKKPTGFEITPIVETHQIKLPIPRKLMKIYDLNFQKGQKMKLEFKEKEKELVYKW